MLTYGVLVSCCLQCALQPQDRQSSPLTSPLACSCPHLPCIHWLPSISPPFLLVHARLALPSSCRPLINEPDRASRLAIARFLPSFHLPACWAATIQCTTCALRAVYKRDCLTLASFTSCRAGFSGGVSMVTYVVPTAPGQSRLYFGLTKPKKGAPLAMRLALGFLGQPWLRWREHLSQNAVLDGDNVFLHMQVGLCDLRLRLSGGLGGGRERGMGGGGKGRTLQVSVCSSARQVSASNGLIMCICCAVLMHLRVGWGGDEGNGQDHGDQGYCCMCAIWLLHACAVHTRKCMPAFTCGSCTSDWQWKNACKVSAWMKPCTLLPPSSHLPFEDILLFKIEFPI